MWNFKAIKKDIDKQGYYVFKNYLKANDLKKIRKSLLETLNYIDGKNDNDLIKKYFIIRNTRPKLKGNWYDISPYNIDLLQSLHKKKNDRFCKKIFSNKCSIFRKTSNSCSR